jgi:hypothetical protein
MKKRREIIVPKTKEAEYALDYEEATADQLDTLFLDQKYYLDFWQSGLLDLFNELSPESLIADYEKAAISNPLIIKQIIDALKNKKGFSYSLAASLTDELITLFEKALLRNTGVYFYL